MAYQTINSSEIEAGKPTKESLFARIKNNLDLHEAQIQSLGAGTSQIQVFNQILSFPEIPIGAAIWTWDVLANSQAQGLSKNWVRAEGSGTWVDGAGVTRNVADSRDRFLRMASTYSAVNVTDTQENTTKMPNNAFTGATSSQSTSTTSPTALNHTHKWYISNPNFTSDQSFDVISTPINFLNRTQNGGGISMSGTNPSIGRDQQDYYTSGPTANGDIGWTHTHTFGHAHNVTISGGDIETRPQTIKLNLLFKRAESVWSYRLLFKAASSFTITTVNLCKIEPGTSGTLTVDVRKGSTAHMAAGSGDISIMSVLPSIVEDGSSSFVENSGTLKTDSSVNVGTGEWVFVNVTSKINGLSKFHIQVVGS